MNWPRQSAFDEFDRRWVTAIRPGIQERLNSLRGTVEDCVPDWKISVALRSSLNLPGDEMLANLIKPSIPLRLIERMRVWPTKLFPNVSFLMSGISAKPDSGDLCASCD
jgi:hypothetical protein